MDRNTLLAKIAALVGQSPARPRFNEPSGSDQGLFFPWRGGHHKADTRQRRRRIRERRSGRRA